jgi:spermidine synthase
LLALLALYVTARNDVTSAAAQDAPSVTAAGELEHEVRSDFSHIVIRRRGPVRSMLFVRDAGAEALESQIDLRRPHVLQFEYLRFMFSSYLFRPHQADVLIIGLGGGGMVHFLARTDPNVRVDAVEIDPEVVKLADTFFNVRTGANVTVHTADGFKFIAEAKKPYDVIYMDAFLKPSADTDGTGAPLALRTRQFYEQMQSKLKPGGAVVFNLNPHAELAADIREIAEAFPQAYVFPLTRFGGAVVVGSTTAERATPQELLARGRGLDLRFQSDLSFQQMARRVQR